jgi:hypothetical protein
VIVQSPEWERGRLAEQMDWDIGMLVISPERQYPAEALWRAVAAAIPWVRRQLEQIANVRIAADHQSQVLNIGHIERMGDINQSNAPIPAGSPAPAATASLADNAGAMPAEQTASEQSPISPPLPGSDSKPGTEPRVLPEWLPAVRKLEERLREVAGLGSEPKLKAAFRQRFKKCRHKDADLLWLEVSDDVRTQPRPPTQADLDALKRGEPIIDAWASEK